MVWLASWVAPSWIHPYNGKMARKTPKTPKKTKKKIERAQ
jgi:hypothetical protein